jgi:hypothetical protein
MGVNCQDHVQLLTGHRIKPYPNNFEELDDFYGDYNDVWEMIQKCFSKGYHEQEFCTWAFTSDLFAKNVDIWFDSVIGDDHLYYPEDENVWIFVYADDQISRLYERLSKCNIPYEYLPSFKIMKDCVEVALNEGWDLVVGFNADTWCRVTDK